MNSFTRALTLGLTLGFAPLAMADGDLQGPVLQIDDDEQAIIEAEQQLEHMLLVDESGQIVLREEFKALLPEDVPAARIQLMLGSLVELDPQGNFRFRNREMIRPYLPMLKNFLDQGGIDRLKGMQDLSPEERERALRDMMEGRGAAPPSPAPMPGPRAEGLRGAAPSGPGRDALERRVRELEERLAILERVLGDRAERPRRGGLFGGENQGGLFGNGGGLTDVGKRVRVWTAGFRKLGEIMTPEDFELLRDTLQGLDLQPGDLRQPEALMGKLQQNMDPASLGRFMEIFSTFIATPEGRAMVAELERTVAQLEAFVNSPQGKRMAEAMEQLQNRNGEGNQGLMRGLERLMQGRDRRGAEPRDEHRRPRTRRHQDAQPQPDRGVNPPAGSKLY